MTDSDLFMKRCIIFSFLFLVVSFCYAKAIPTYSLTQPDPSKLQLGSVYAFVLDVEKKAVLYSKNANVAVPIASITKLMTAIVVLDSDQPLNEYVTIRKIKSKHKKNAYSRMRVSSRLKRSDLLRLALMASENLAASVLALDYPGGRAAFIVAMNDKAKSLGMVKTRFIDTTGLSPENVSTASDLAKLLVAASSYRKIMVYSTTKNHVAFFKKPSYRLAFWNTNQLVHRSSWNILVSKTGYLDEAGRCLLMLAEINGKPVVMVLLDSLGKRTPIGDAGRIRRWITTGYSGPVAGVALKYEREKIKYLWSQKIKR